MPTDTDKIVAAILANAVLVKSTSRSAESAVDFYHECLAFLAAKPAPVYDAAEDAEARRLNDEIGG